MTGTINLKGLRTNNLKNISLRIPKHKIVVFTGVSGSGKSSIVFDTLASEAQRRLYDNFSMFVRNFLPRYDQPDADAIDNLPMAIIIDQKHLGGGSRSTVGTITDIYTVLRMLYSRVGKPFAGYSNSFSFNDPAGACPVCGGSGISVEVDIEKIIDKSKSILEGGIVFPVFAIGSLYGDSFAYSGIIDSSKKLQDFSQAEMEELLYGKSRKIKLVSPNYSINTIYEGVVNKFKRLYIDRDISTMSAATKNKVAAFTKQAVCPECAGARLNKKVLGCKINNLSIADAASLEVDALIAFLQSIPGSVAAPLVADLIERLSHLQEMGLSYLSLNRPTDTLSGGESQRIKMVKNLSSGLVDVMYIFDEPSVGLHPRDVHRMNELLIKLRDKGNTVVVVEHDPDVIKVADHIVDVGPGAGANGGKIVFEGSYAALQKASTITGKHINARLAMKPTVRKPSGWLAVTNGTANNLKNVSTHIPLGVLSVITGVAGSGKSSLIYDEFLRQHPSAVVVDQSPVGTSYRSNPATYTGLMDKLRQLFGKTNHVSPSLFSFNSQGACEKCQGTGIIYTDLGAMSGVKNICEVCSGKRFKQDVLHYKVHGASIADVLDMTVAQALQLFSQSDIVKILQSLEDVGVGYLTLGQSLDTLSGGECQRIKLAGQLHKQGDIYVLDEPTTGLHFADVRHLLAIINRLVDGGNTVVVIEHNLDIIRNADWIIDLGPEGGSKGGAILFEGEPQELANNKASITAKYI